jgi:hypothetical protein
MRVCVRVRGGMAVGRVVAAANVTALNTDPQVKPRFPCGQAFLASPDPFGEAGELDVVAMTALHRDDDATDAFRPHPTNARSATAHTSSAKGGWVRCTCEQAKAGLDRRMANLLVARFASHAGHSGEAERERPRNPRCWAHAGSQSLHSPWKKSGTRGAAGVLLGCLARLRWLGSFRRR